MSSSIRVKVQLELIYDTGECWGDDFTLGELRKRTVEDAKNHAKKVVTDLNGERGTSYARLIDVGEPIVTFGKEKV